MAQINVNPLDDVQRALFDAETHEQVENAIRFGGNVNEIADTRGMSPFHHAIVEGRTGVAQAMIKGGADLEAPVPSGLTLAEDPAYPKEEYHETPNQEAYNRVAGMRPLDVAVEHMQADTVHDLLEAGATLERGRRETPVLHHALDHFGPSGYDTTQVLLEHGADPNQPNPKQHQETPLHREMPVVTMNLLMDHGANVDALDGRGRTPLVNAIHSNRQEAASFLMENGADTAQALEHPSIAERGWKKSTIDTLRMVNDADGGQNPVATYHIDRIDGKLKESEPVEQVAEVEAPAPAPDTTEYVASPERRLVASRMIQWGLEKQNMQTIADEVDYHGPSILNETHDEHGQTLLAGAAFLDRENPGESKLMRGLLDLGADPNARNVDGTPALIEVKDNKENLSALLAAGADPNAVDPQDGRTALHRVCMQGDDANAERVNALLDYGAKTDIKDHEGNTPLAYSGANGHRSPTEALMRRERSRGDEQPGLPED